VELRRQALRLSALLPILFLWAAPAFAQIEGPPPTQSLEDPLDGHVFSVPILASVNSHGGFDSDGCSYSSGAQARYFAVATSPTSLYSARLETWGRGLTEANKPDVLRSLVVLGAEVSDASRLQVSERYELAAAVAELVGQDRFEIGDLFLHAAWTVRDSVVGFLPSVSGSGDAWSKLGELVRLSKEVTHPRGRTIALFDMARLAHRGGFVHERDALLAQLDNFEDAGIGGKEKRSEFLLRVREEERLLRRARERYLEGVRQNERRGSERAHYRFLAAEMARRVGDLDTADVELAELALDNAVPKDVKGLVSDVRSVLKVQARSGEAAVSKLKGDNK